MKREFPLYPVLVLVLGCITFRLLSSHIPELMPNISPLMALAYVGAMYLPRRWGWLVGPAAFLVTDLALVSVNYRAEGAMFSWWTAISLGLYAAVGGFGLWIAQRKSLSKIITGSLACSLMFYLVANTFSWWHEIALHAPDAYAATWAGWWQANTFGLPGYAPTWLFLRNSMAGDLFFTLLFLLVLDRGFLFGRLPAKPSARPA